MSLAFSPLLPLWMLAVLAGLVAAGAALRVRASLPGAALRLLAGLLAVAFLAGPERRDEETQGLADIAVLLVDESDSMGLGGRDRIAEAAAGRLEADLAARGVELRRGTIPGRAETALGPALSAALAGVPRARLSAVFLLTDGQLTEVPDAASLGLGVPVHALLTGDPAAQRDRRVRIVSAPRYGVVGESVPLTFRVEDEGRTGSVPVTLSVGGVVQAESPVEIGRDVTLSVALDAPGETVVEIAVPEARGELTTANNRAGAPLTAIRDRLRVLLVSGEPHAGERVWRNTLKSDPAVDLVHFTILKPMDKDARAFPGDLNLIPFPHEELFLDKLDGFDMVIFDRYSYRAVLRAYEFERIAQYAREGGAILIASGPEFAGAGSIAEQRSLAYVLPARPAGRAVERAFVPALSDIGRRHPVTAGLGEAGEWGRWLRVMPATVSEGETLMEGPNGEPLLVLSRVGEGRIAMLMSDHVWLWARGFDGGGPYGELLRRLAHWLMKEPSLDEEALRASLGRDGRLSVERRTLGDEPAPVEVEAPDGGRTTLELRRTAPGLFGGGMTADASGLYRVTTTAPDGSPLFAVAALGESAPPETDAVRTTDAAVRPLVEASSGHVGVLAAADARLPSLRTVREGRIAGGRDWAGLVARNAETVLSVSAAPLLPLWAWLVAILAALVGAWAVEGRRR
ncbi:hypothetical protein [Parvularcula dongshanensis]|uniref:Putative membrane protein n=1 Tax=Parvularcula dongshanensis TaxID=1173995 RepID=A0A840HZ72_9PROT|nr:hypothetical protein [Parvularcula dongshanensis]MBB4657869.1 putative membrane protein [Parvularcula dongshanensis]